MSWPGSTLPAGYRKPRRRKLRRPRTPAEHAKAVARKRKIDEAAKAHLEYARSKGERGTPPEQARSYELAGLDEAARRLGFAEGAVGMPADALYDHCLRKWMRRRAHPSKRKGAPSASVLRLDDLVGGRGAVAVHTGRPGDLFDFRFPVSTTDDARGDHAKDLKAFVGFLVSTHRQASKFPEGNASCGRCGRSLGGDVKCPACGWLKLPSTTKATAADFVDACEVESATPERLATGPWDAAFGGGVVATSTIIVFAKPGAGKSTLAMQISAALAELRGRPALYANVEQIGPEVKLALDRLGLATKRGRFLFFTDFATTHGLRRGDECSAPPSCIVVDSVTACCGKDMHAAVEVAKRAKRYAVRHSCPVVMCVHVTKDEEPAGLMSLVHECDVVASLRMPEEDHGRRVLVATKNRFGAAHVAVPLLMSERGLVSLNRTGDGQGASGAYDSSQ